MMAQVPAKTPSAAAKGTDLAKADPATGHRESPPSHFPPVAEPPSGLPVGYRLASSDGGAYN